MGAGIWLHGWLEWLGLADGLFFWGLSFYFAFNFDSNVLLPYKTNLIKLKLKISTSKYFKLN